MFFNAFRINKGDIDAEYERVIKKVQNAKADTLKREDLKAQMEDFLKVRTPFVCLIQLSLCVDGDCTS